MPAASASRRRASRISKLACKQNEQPTCHQHQQTDVPASIRKQIAPAESLNRLLVDLPPGCKTVGSKWIFKKKTDVDGIVHTYKARLVAKGYIQLYGVDYEETFSPVADIRAIRILISIAAFYNYEIWQMDVKTTFLNGYLDEDIYMVQPESFVDPNHPRKDLREATFILGIKIYRDRTQGASTPKEVKHMQNVHYASAVGSIIGAVEWKSSKQSTAAMSATEAECIAASEVVIEAVWIRKFISGLGIELTINDPIRMFCDNSAALHFANEPGVRRGARHYHMRYHLKIT
nr:retrotransposon protein, putative, Ty1-copia subclass [Tanacetum cinerariifolium]